MVIALSILATALLAAFVFVALRLVRLRSRYATVIDADAAARDIRARAEEDAARLRHEGQDAIARARVDADELTRRGLAAEQASQARAEQLDTDIAQRWSGLEAAIRVRDDEALATLRGEIGRLERLASDTKSAAKDLGQRYLDSKATYERLRREVSMLEENLEDISFGLYRPHFTFESSARYKAELTALYEKKKGLVRAGKAASSPVSWTVGDSKREGEKMVKQQLKLMLRAFNGEVDAAVAKVTWNNAAKMEERIRKAFATVNDSGGVLQASISLDYLNLSFSELRLTHELETKLYEEKEEQRQIREQMREEEKAQREIERAEREAMAEEARYQKALERARAEVERAKGGELAIAQAKVDALELQLEQAHLKTLSAISMAQLTRAGYVYVISNIGSFGEGVFKIGMTRRLEPMERIYELGDASVPFYFDVHAMIYSDDAPALENAFHRQFARQRMNMLNMRKEFFRVDLADIERFALSHHADIRFTLLAEAREYRETLALRSLDQVVTEVHSPSFPELLVEA